MSQTVDQIYIANPSTTMIATDLMYLVHSPYTSGTDSAITYANFKTAVNSAAVLLSPAGNQAITAHNLAVNAGVVASGTTAGGFAGEFIAYSTTANKGSVGLLAASSSTAFGQLISNTSGLAQAQVVSIPDLGATTGNFITSVATQRQVIGSIFQLNDDLNNNYIEFLDVAGTIFDGGLTMQNSYDGSNQFVIQTNPLSSPSMGLTLNVIGDGQFILNGGGNTPFVIESGSNGQHITNFTFINSAQTRTVTFPDANGTVILSSGAASQSSSLTIGTAYQNTLGYDVVLTVYLAVSSSTTASVLLGVGATNTPTQQTIISGVTLAALNIITVPIYLPAGYYAKLSTSGTIVVTISGQQVMPV